MIAQKQLSSDNRQFALTMRDGFSLIEVMIALFVIALGIGSSLTALRIGFGMVETARDETIASQFLQSEIETLRLKNWAELSALPREEEFWLDSEFDDSTRDRFRCVRLIEDIRPNAYIKQITLSITWTSSNGVTRSRQYHTRISREGLNDYYYRSM